MSSKPPASLSREDVCETAKPVRPRSRVLWRRALWVWFILIGILLTGNAIVSQTTFQQLNKQRTLSLTARALQLDFLVYLSTLKDAEASQRGYLLTGDKTYLEPYLEAQKTLRQLTQNILKNLGDNNSGRAVFVEVVEITGRKLQEMEATINAYNSGGREAADKIVEQNQGKFLMDEIRETVDALSKRQVRELDQLIEKTLVIRLWAYWLSLVTSISGIIFLGVLFLYTHRTLEQRAALLKAQQIAAENVGRALEEKERAFSDLVQVNKVKDEFLAIVSHELRTPLNAILGWATLLKEGATPEEYAEGLQSIDRNARSQSILIEDLLDVSRVVTGKIRLHVAPVDLREIVRTTVESSRPALDAKKITLELQLSNDAPAISGDADRLQQVVWNLLSNAIKFTPKEGHIWLSVQRIGSSLVLIVKDDGVGISPDFLPQMFERFAQADTSTSRGQGGLGLGLAIVRHIVELHGGRVHVQSEGLGKGATFQMEIPVMAMLGDTLPGPPDGASTIAEMPGAAHIEDPESGPLPDLKGVRIFLVDDQPDTVRVLSSVLIRCGATIFTANTAADALQGLVDSKAQILVSDIGLPDMDGYELIGKVRLLDDPTLQAVPALALTAFARKEDRIQALSAGFNDHLAKPADALDFARRVGRLAAQKVA